jgi:hypothetical protein
MAEEQSPGDAPVQPIRDTTRNLVEAIWLDVWPRAGAIVDFGIDSQEHYEALYYGVREGEITVEALDAALGKGDQLTALARSAPSNPHRDVEFHTSWDGLIVEPESDAPEDSFDPDPEWIARSGYAQALFDEWREDYAARAKEFDTSGYWQVWHQRGWPESRLAELFGGPPATFPDDYVHVADVPAASLEEAVRLTKNQGNILDADAKSWPGNPDVLSHVFAPRETDRGDVIVDPGGLAFRVEREGFTAIDRDARPAPPGSVAEPGRTNERDLDRGR